MSMNDPLSDLLSSIKNAERAGKDELTFKPVNKLAIEVLKIFKEHGYKRILSHSYNRNHEKYLVKMGFQQEMIDEKRMFVKYVN